MTVTDDHPIQFSESDQLELADYRPLNRFAMVSCLLGCLAPAALLHPAFGVLPLFSLILGVLACWQIRSADIPQSGKALAIAGIYLSLLFGSWAAAYEATRTARLNRQAREFAEQWLDLFRQGKFHEAHQLVMRETDRAPLGTSLEKLYSLESAEESRQQRAAQAAHQDEHAGPERDVAMIDMMTPIPRDEFDRYFADALRARVKEMGPGARIDFRGSGLIATMSAQELAIELHFEITPGGAGGSQPFPVTITLQRTRYSGLTADWHVANLGDPKAG